MVHRPVSALQPVPANKDLLAHAMPIHWFSGCLYLCYKAELSSMMWTHHLQSLKYIPSGPLQEKTDNH